MQDMALELRGDYIELDKLLKATRQGPPVGPGRGRGPRVGLGVLAPGVAGPVRQGPP